MANSWYIVRPHLPVYSHSRPAGDTVNTSNVGLSVGRPSAPKADLSRPTSLLSVNPMCRVVCVFLVLENALYRYTYLARYGHCVYNLIFVTFSK